MKKFLAFILCILLICAMPIVAFAESEVIEETPPVVETLPIEETTPETEPPVTTPPTDSTPLPTPPEPTLEEEAKATTEIIKAWFEKNSGALTIVFTIIGYGLAMFKKIKNVVKSATTMNNNAISIAENSDRTTAAALVKLDIATEVIGSYKDKTEELLAEVRESNEEKQALKKALNETQTLLKAAKLAIKALSDEVAKLITLANLPNTVKSELYEQHLENVRAILEVENTEVKEDDVEQKA